MTERLPTLYINGMLIENYQATQTDQLRGTVLRISAPDYDVTRVMREGDRG